MPIPFVDVSDGFKGGFYAVFFNLAGLKGGDEVFAREAQDIESVFAGEGDEFAGLGPVDL